jgi:hypothetical protein
MKVFAIEQKPSHSGMRGRHTRPVSSVDWLGGPKSAAVRRILRPPRLHASLAVGVPGDAYETEADSVADEVMRVPEHQIQAEFT